MCAIVFLSNNKYLSFKTINVNIFWIFICFILFEAHDTINKYKYLSLWDLNLNLPHKIYRVKKLMINYVDDYINSSLWQISNVNNDWLMWLINSIIIFLYLRYKEIKLIKILKIFVF